MLAVLALLLSGCFNGPDDELDRPTKDVTVTPSGVATVVPTLPRNPAVARDTVVWGQGSSLDVGRRIVHVSPLHVDRLAVTSGGVYVLSGARLWSVSDSTARDSGFGQVTALTVSPDRRYLALVDRVHGVKDAKGTPLAAIVVYDTTTGKAVVDSSVGMGDPSRDDLAQLYAASMISLRGFTGGAVLASTPGGTYAYPLDGGKPQRVAAGTLGETVLTRPDGGVAVALGMTGGRVVVRDASTGRDVVMKGMPAYLRFGGWLGADTFYGVGRSSTAAKAAQSIVRCDLKSRACTVVVPSSQVARTPAVVLPADGS